MNLKIGSQYKIIVNVNKILTYEGIIIESPDPDFVSFVDKYNNKQSYNKNVIVSITELNKEGNDGYSNS